MSTTFSFVLNAGEGGKYWIWGSCHYRNAK